MMILTIRTDKPEAEIGLYNGSVQLSYETWQAHRQLAETLHVKIQTLIESKSKSWSDVRGIVCFQGPGSFTGLRIGLTVANTFVYSFTLPIVATKDPDWIERGIKRLEQNDSDELALPFYGADVHITRQKK